MATNQSFENSRVSEGTLRTDRAQSEIADMIAEGGPVQQNRASLAAASTLPGHRVLKAAGEELGDIEELMLNLDSGHIEYAVLSFSGIAGIGNKRFPVPWSALRVDPGEQDLVLDRDRRALGGAPRFDKDSWPDIADPAFGRAVHAYYGTTP